jgi:hypothetical protein
MGIVSRVLAGALIAGGLSCARPRTPWEPCCDDFAACSAVLRSRLADTKPAIDQCAYDASTLVGAFGPSTCPVVVELLQNPSTWPLGLNAFTHMVATDRACALPAFVASYRAHPNPRALVALRGIRDPEVAALFVETLEAEPRTREWSTRIDLVATEGDLASAALPRLATIAASHWNAEVRAAAARAYGAISGTAIEPGPDVCPPRVTRTPAGARTRWDVAVASGWVGELWGSPGHDFRTPYEEGGCASMKAIDDGPRSLPVPLPIDPDAARQTVVGEGCGGGWYVERRIMASDGRSMVEWRAGGEGGLAAFALEPDGGADVLIRLVTRGGHEACEGVTVVEGVEGLRAGGFELIHLDRDGTITVRN